MRQPSDASATWHAAPGGPPPPPSPRLGDALVDVTVDEAVADVVVPVAVAGVAGAGGAGAAVEDGAGSGRV